MNKNIKRDIKDFFRVMFYLVNVVSWSVWCIVITRAMNNNGIQYLHFNIFNEMLWEFVLFWLILIFVVIFSIIELKKIYRME